MAPYVRDAWPRLSRIRPANDRERSRNDGNGWSIESAGQEPDSGIAAGSEIGSENTLKVEARVQIPLGLRTENRRSTALFSALMGGEGGDWRRQIPQISRTSGA
jgi:hypothetical protein